MQRIVFHRDRESRERLARFVAVCYAQHLFFFFLSDVLPSYYHAFSMRRRGEGDKEKQQKEKEVGSVE